MFGGEKGIASEALRAHAVELHKVSDGLRAAIRHLNMQASAIDRQAQACELAALLDDKGRHYVLQKGGLVPGTTRWDFLSERGLVGERAGVWGWTVLGLAVRRAFGDGALPTIPHETR